MPNASAEILLVTEYPGTGPVGNSNNPDACVSKACTYATEKIRKKAGKTGK